jgi:uncharacterized protein
MTRITKDVPDAASLVRLREFLASSQRSEDTLRYEELNGFLFAVNCSPERVPPSSWLPMVFGDGQPSFEDPTEASIILRAILELHNSINRDILSGRVGLPEGCGPERDPLANLELGSPIGMWSRGFLLGHQYLVELWEEHTPSQLAEELGSIVMVLTFFADRKLAESYHREFSKGGLDLEHMAKSLGELLPSAMEEYAHLGRSMLQAPLKRRTKAQPTRREKVARNEPCPCGSGKKYKKCCGASVH